MRRILQLLAILCLSMPGLTWATGLVVYDGDRASALGELQSLDVNVAVTDGYASVTEQRRYLVVTEVARQKLRFYRPTRPGTEGLRVVFQEQDVPIVTIGDGYATLRRTELMRHLREPGIARGASEPLSESAQFEAPGVGYTVVELTVEYQTALDNWDTLRGLRIPIDWQEQAVNSMNVTVGATTEDPLRVLYSPFHELQVARTSDHEATASYYGYQVCTTNDLVLLLATGDEELRVDVLPYRYSDAEGGFFMALLTPSKTADPVPRDLVFVIDTSGSMDGEKIAQAREALNSVIAGLSPKDRFTIVEFANNATPMTDEAQAASRAFVTEATEYVDAMKANGGTNLFDALQLGLDVLPFSQDRPRYIVLLTDGQPTEGETDTEAILESVSRRNEGQARVFTFGIGNDVNTVLLDRLALDSAGDAIYIRPGESVVGPVEEFFESIAGAALVNPTIDSSSFQMSDFLPETLPDLFANQTLAVVGRYDRGGVGDLVIRGTSGGEEYTRTFEVDLPEYSTWNGHVPRIWATRYVGTLLHQIKLGDTDPMLPETATQIAARFGVVTEFTNFVLDEDGNAVMRYTNVPLDVTGSTAVDTSASLDGYQNSGSGGATFDNFVRYIGARTLPTTDGWFTDTSVERPSWIDISFGSDLFFMLIERHAEIAALMAVGRDVAFELHGVDYRVSDTIADPNRPAEIDALPQIDQAPTPSHAAVRLMVEETRPSPSPDPRGVDSAEESAGGLGETEVRGGCATPGGRGPGPIALITALFLGLGLARARR